MEKPKGFMLEIDGVRRALENPITEGGDYTSDEWWNVIDLSTAPGRLSREDFLRLGSAVRRVNRNLGIVFVCLEIDWLTQGILSGTDETMIDIYNNTVGQLNKMNHGLEGVNELLPINLEDANLLRQRYSGSFVRS